MKYKCNIPKVQFTENILLSAWKKNKDTVDSFLEKFSNRAPSHFFPIYSLLCTILVFSIRYCVDSFRRLVYICNTYLGRYIFKDIFLIITFLLSYLISMWKHIGDNPRLVMDLLNRSKSNVNFHALYLFWIMHPTT